MDVGVTVPLSALCRGRAHSLGMCSALLSLQLIRPFPDSPQDLDVTVLTSLPCLGLLMVAWRVGTDQGGKLVLAPTPAPSVVLVLLGQGRRVTRRTEAKDAGHGQLTPNCPSSGLPAELHLQRNLPDTDQSEPVVAPGLASLLGLCLWFTSRAALEWLYILHLES